MNIGDMVRIVGTGQEAVVMSHIIKFRNFKFIKCYEVMYQRKNGSMTTIFWLHPHSLIAI